MTAYSSYLKSIGALYHSDLSRREKKCAFCGAEFCDITKRNLHHSCSIVCSRNLGTIKRHENGTYNPTDEQKLARSEVMKKKHLNGVLFTDDMRKNHRAAMDRLVASGTQIHPCPNHWTKTEAGRKKVSQLKLGKKLGQTAREHMSQGAARRVRTKRETHYTSACGGTRADLGMYFRSNWEANFARIQNFLGKTWEYESQTFKLSSTMSYTPDFKIDDTFYELKGRMTDLCMEKFKIMNDKFPDIKDKFPDIKIVGPEEYTELRKQYKNKVKWEGK